MAELKVEKPSASPTRSREELMALLSKNPNVNPQTGAPAPATPKGLPVAAPKESFLDVVGQRMQPDLTQGGPIDMRVSPVTGAPSPRLGETPAPAVDTDRAAMLFAKTHGSAFDPKSSADKKKMASITSLMGQEGSEALTPNQFALKIYRTTKK